MPISIYSHVKITGSALSCLVLTVGCSTTPQFTIKGLSDIKTAAISDAELRLSALHKIITDSNETRAVLLHFKGDNDFRCRLALNREAAELDRRINALRLVESYIKLLEAFEKRASNQDAQFSALVGAFNSVNAISGGQGTPLLGPTTQLLLLGKNIIQQIDRQNFNYDVAKEAKKNHKNFEKIVDDLAAGLITADNDLTTKIKIWDECEAELIEWHIKNKDGSNIEFEDRYRLYIRKKNLILSMGADRDPINIKEHPISKLKLAHEKLFSFSALSHDEKIKFIQEMLDAVNQFNDTRQKALEQFKAISALSG